MKNLNEYKYYIFDLDGTLIDSMPVWSDFGLEFLKKEGVVPDFDYKKDIMRLSFKETAEYFIKVFGIKKTADEIIKGITEIYADKYKYEIPLKEGVYEFLEKSSNSGIKMSILTASERYYIIPLLKRLGIEKFFDRLITCSEINMNKQNGEIYNKACEILGYKKEYTAVFEDAMHAVKSAKEGGFFTVAIYDEAEKDNVENIRETSDLFINNFNEI